MFLPLSSKDEASMFQDFCSIGWRDNYVGGLEGDENLDVFSLERTVNFSKESPLKLKS